MTIEPSSAAASGPIEPFARLTSSTLRSVKTCRTANRGSVWPRMARMVGRSRNARSLDMTGPSTWARCSTLKASNHAQKASRPHGSDFSAWPTAFRRNWSLVNSVGSATRDGWLLAAMVSSPAWRTSLVRGPHDSRHNECSRPSTWSTTSSRFDG